MGSADPLAVLRARYVAQHGARRALRAEGLAALWAAGQVLEAAQVERARAQRLFETAKERDDAAMPDGWGLDDDGDPIEPEPYPREPNGLAWPFRPQRLRGRPAWSAATWAALGRLAWWARKEEQWAATCQRLARELLAGTTESAAPARRVARSAWIWGRDGNQGE